MKLFVSTLLTPGPSKEQKLVRQVKKWRRPVDFSLAPGEKALFLANYAEGTVPVYEPDSFNE
jgi:hypothetical protein